MEVTQKKTVIRKYFPTACEKDCFFLQYLNEKVKNVLGIIIMSRVESKELKANNQKKNFGASF